MQKQEFSQAAESISNETHGSSIVEYLGLIVGGQILLVLLALLMHLHGPKQLSDFLGSAASGWAQAIGSAVAIFASYKMGENTFKRQLTRDEITELEKRKHSLDVLAEVFLNAYQVDTSSMIIDKAPDYVQETKSMAVDALHQLQSIPALSVPLSVQVAQLNFCRQAMIAYIGFADCWEESKDLDILKEWAAYPDQKMNIALAAFKICNSESKKLQEEITQLKRRLH